MKELEWKNLGGLFLSIYEIILEVRRRGMMNLLGVELLYFVGGVKS